MSRKPDNIDYSMKLTARLLAIASCREVQAPRLRRSVSRGRSIGNAWGMKSPAPHKASKRARTL